MSLEVIYVTRHGFRSNWLVNHLTGEYTASILSPTGIPSDPALAGKGVDQAQELAAHLKNLDPPIQRFYSSPFYRCIQTILPAVEAISPTSSDPETHKIRGENGVGEWYGMARFDHPSPADPEVLKKLFERYDEEYESYIKPSTKGERIDQLHDRTAYALHRIIEKSDREGVKAIVICTHAATLIAMGRVLTGVMPEDVGEEDFYPFTCGLTRFVRRSTKASDQSSTQKWSGPGSPIPEVAWKGEGVGGGWELRENGDCSFLSGGEERGWRFSGDEAFDTAGDGAATDAGAELGVVVEVNKKRKNSPKQARL